MGTLPYLLLVVLSSLSLVPRAAAYSEYSCNGTTGNFTAASAFGANLARLVAALPANASSSPSLFASAAVGAAPDTAYGLALCRGDVTDAGVCSACLADAFGRLRRLCGADRDATFYADLCTARYSGGDFLARPDDNSPVINALDVNGSTYYGWDARNATSRTLFLSLVGTLFGEMAMYAAYNSSAARMFASAAMYVNPQLPTVYGFVQCTPDLSRAQCWDCFQVLQDQNRRWYDGREGGRILGVRCSFRYEAYHFFGGMPEVRIGLKGDPSSPAAETEIHGSNHRVVLIVAVIVSITAFSAMMAAGLVIIRARRRKGAEKKRKLQLEAQSRNSSTTEDALKLWRIEESSSEFTLYDFAELAAATGGFSDENLLGRGGFGPGKLPDGAEIAVKRLAAHSGQGLEEFKNEIQLIAKLQHTNLVRLVGCCVQEEEKLLAWQLWRDGRVFELIDPTLGERGDVATIVRCVKVALLCVQESATDRPTMADVTAMLATAGDAASAGPLPDPKRPPHFSLRVATTSGSDDDCGSRTRFTTSCSTNDLTITSIHEGR
ncbi:Cysteine-rich receptor-like protein kinase 25 [Zea mays]|uniref:Cysteine-rich receptor-like protein kinase 25 n=1 Tax=Zea mays TaxID=4577 RepID=A0A1D6IDY2_MAIZE|nr:Cysteine-rich receptor-like protein kinase 25 [Zea mays]